jgi:hypothetical protein
MGMGDVQVKQFLVALTIIVTLLMGGGAVGYLRGYNAGHTHGYLAGVNSRKTPAKGVGVFACDHMVALVATDQFGHLAVVTPHAPAADTVARAVRELPEADLTRINLEFRCQKETETSYR